MRIKAAVARAYGAPLVIEGVELAEPGPDEVLVRLIAAGVARPDRDAIAGDLAMPLPFVPGSEGAGIVERVGDDVTQLAVGDSVVVGYAACSACEACMAGNPRACADFAALNLTGRRLDGTASLSGESETGESAPINGYFFGQSSFATHVVCKAASAIKLDAGAPLEILAALAGELLNGAAVVVEGFELGEDDSIVIAGADATGLVATMVAKARGATTIIVADPDEGRRALATDCGATVAMHTDDRLADIVKSMTGAGARFAFDTTGNPTAIRACLESLAPGGTCAIVDPAWGNQKDLYDFARDGATIIAADAKLTPDRLLRELAVLQADGKLPIDRFINFFPFELVNDAIAASDAGDVVKAVLRFPLGAFGDLDRAQTEGAAREAPKPEVRPEPVEDAAKPSVEAAVTA